MIAALLPIVAIAAPTDAAARFDVLRTLVGEWRPADDAGSTLRLRFSLTAGGTVLVEEWQRRGQPHSLTLYHRDGTRLIATHYCPQGNQPRLASQPGGGAAVVQFRFIDATDLDRGGEAYLVDLSFDLSDPATPLRRETYRNGDNVETSELRLVRIR